MNANDRSKIASLLDGIATDDTISIISAGNWLIAHHPKLVAQMETTDWWEVPHKCPGCQRSVTPEQVKEWNGFCDTCLENGTNLEPRFSRE